jgi:hypothetical protein
LTRDEAAKLLWTAYRGHKASHLARFILIALYTGTRKDAILRMGFEPNTVGGWFDLNRGIMFRRSKAERQTRKRRTPARIPRQLAAHLCRWRANGSSCAVEYQGARVGDVKRAFAKAVKEANVSPARRTRSSTRRSLGAYRTARASGMRPVFSQPAQRQSRRSTVIIHLLSRRVPYALSSAAEFQLRVTVTPNLKQIGREQIWGK